VTLPLLGLSTRSARRPARGRRGGAVPATRGSSPQRPRGTRARATPGDAVCVCAVCACVRACVRVHTCVCAHALCARARDRSGGAVQPPAGAAHLLRAHARRRLLRDAHARRGVRTRTLARVVPICHPSLARLPGRHSPCLHRQQALCSAAAAPTRARVLLTEHRWRGDGRAAATRVPCRRVHSSPMAQSASRWSTSCCSCARSLRSRPPSTSASSRLPAEHRRTCWAPRGPVAHEHALAPAPRSLCA